MAFERIFTDDELDHLATPLSIHVERAAKAREATGLPWVIDQMNQECLGIYDAYVSWMGVLQSYIVERAGEGAHDMALTWVAEYGTRPFVRSWAGLDARGRALKLAERLRASGSTFDVSEDERRVRFTLDPWGPVRWWRQSDTAGQSWEGPAAVRADRLRYPCYGHYDPPVSFAVLSGGRPLTHGRDELPSFLATEIQFLESVPIELFGYPIAAIELGERADDPSHLDVYKDPADVPSEVYARAGLSKPVLGSGSRDDHGRLFTEEELSRMGTPLSLQVQQAAGADDHAALLEISAGMDTELVGAKDPVGVTIAGLLSWIAWHFGEVAAEEALARTAEVVMAPFLSAVRDLTIKEAIPAWCVAWRSHGSTFWMDEHEETVILRGRPLGACHRMLSHAYQPRVERISESRVRYPTFGCYDAPASMHLMREPRGITHGKTRYPIYSCHCHMLHEIYPIDQVGHPLWVEEHNIDDWDGEMIHTHYKDPSAWPARYYEQVGRSKP